MTLAMFLFIVAAILAAIGAFFNPPRVTLGWLAVCLIAVALSLPWHIAG